MSGGRSVLKKSVDPVDPVDLECFLRVSNIASDNVPGNVGVLACVTHDRHLVGDKQRLIAVNCLAHPGYQVKKSSIRTTTDHELMPLVIAACHQSMHDDFVGKLSGKSRKLLPDSGKAVGRAELDGEALKHGDYGRQLTKLKSTQWGKPKSFTVLALNLAFTFQCDESFAQRCTTHSKLCCQLHFIDSFAGFYVASTHFRQQLFPHLRAKCSAFDCQEVLRRMAMLSPGSAYGARVSSPTVSQVYTEYKIMTWTSARQSVSKG